MCTVTHLPTQDGFILSSNRDESPLRSDTPVVQEVIGERKVTFPKDQKGGSWIFADDLGRVLIVLNGAFIRHRHQPPYKMSRGLIAKKFFQTEDSITFLRDLDLNGIEPFTMVIFNGSALIELRWDEDIKHITHKDPTLPHIWSSSTLYSPEIQAIRADWFYNQLKNEKKHTLSLAKKLHRDGDIGDPRQNYIMNRDNIVRTVSICHVEINGSTPVMHFESLV